MFLRTILLLTSLVATSALHAAEPDFAYFFDKHPSQIRHVVSCGDWQFEKLHGFFRVVEAYQFAQSFLYVQWMTKYDFQTSETHAVNTVEFPEINGKDAAITLSEILCSSSPGNTRINANANFAHEDKWYDLRLDLNQQPGKYTLEFVRKPAGPDKHP
jgi:hypothetical protein